KIKIKNHNKDTMDKKFLYVAALLIVIFLILYGANISLKPRESFDAEKINGLIMLIEFEGINGILQWEKVLDKNNITALVKAQENVLKEYPEVFKRLADKGYEIAGGYDEAPFWDMPYEEQYSLMKEAEDTVECITEKPMRVFGKSLFCL
ncbi:MAG: hypothetical protein PHF45_01050, partial [Candidatus Pacebacteria bacterium]|nr:hypothetical protein [Candidatus Paceibacterota bacterium]